jgi:hypothetical protein
VEQTYVIAPIQTGYPLRADVEVVPAATLPRLLAAL